jgi:hypothetical protein
MEQLFETAVELTIEGNTTARGMLKPLHLALAREFRVLFPASVYGARPTRAAAERQGSVPLPVFETGGQL